MTDLNDCDGILETSPEPEDMLDSAFVNTDSPTETLEEEFKRAREILKPEKEIEIYAYGTKLKVYVFNEEPFAMGYITITPQTNAALNGLEEVTISIDRHWLEKVEGGVDVIDDYHLRLNLNRPGNNDSVEYHTDSTKNSLPQAFETLLKMRDCIEDHRTEKQKLANAKNWER